MVRYDYCSNLLNITNKRDSTKANSYGIIICLSSKDYSDKLNHYLKLDFAEAQDKYLE